MKVNMLKLPLKTVVAAASISLQSFAIAGAQGTPVFDDDPIVAGETPESRKGYEIAARSDRSDFGFGNSIVEGKMTLRNAAGQTSQRQIKISTLEKENETVGDKSLVVFLSPQDVDGTALLSHAKILEPDDQWLYLPALKRVKRISSVNKSGPFVGSEFAFEDFTITELNKFTYKYIGEATFEGMETDIVERFPRYERSGYAKQISWIDREIFQPRKVEFYDRRGDLLKTLTLADYRDYDGVWRAHSLTMENHQTGKSTELEFGKFDFDSGLDETDFVKGVLERIR